MENNTSILFRSEDILLPEIFNKDKIVNELLKINNIIYTNLWNDKISLKIITPTNRKSFITPNLETVLENMNINTLITKEIIQSYSYYKNSYNVMANFFLYFLSEFFINLFSLSKEEVLFNKIKLIQYMDELYKIISSTLNKQENHNSLCLEYDSLFHSKENENKIFLKQNIFKDIYDFLHTKENTNIKFIISEKNFSLDSYIGLVLKLKIPHNSKCFYKFNTRIKIDNNIKIQNIFIHKSDKSFNLEYIKEIICCPTIKRFDENEIILEFIQTFILKNKINLILTIGCSINSKIKEILNSYDIFYFEWLNWNNYQVR